MRILQVIPYFHPAYAFGGPANVVYQISKGLAKRGNEIVVYTSDALDFSSRLRDVSDNLVDGMRVHYFRNLTMALVKKFKLFVTPQMVSRAIFEVGGFDIIHLHEYTTFQNICVAHYARKNSVPYILQAHGSLPRIMSKRMLKLIYDLVYGRSLLENASKVIALTKTEAQQYMRVGLPRKKISIIPNGIDFTEFDHLPTKGFFRRKYNIGDDRKIVLYLGRINRIKGIDLLAKAHTRIIMNPKYRRVVLVIAGPDDGYLSKLRALTNALQIENAVLVLGPLYGKNKLEAYVDADIYVLPSRYETFPIGLLEAYACAKPVIASKVGGMADLVLNHVTGLSFEAGNTEQLAADIAFLLDNNEEAQRMGVRGRQLVKEKFAIEKVVDQLEALYKATSGS